MDPADMRRGRLGFSIVRLAKPRQDRSWHSPVTSARSPRAARRVYVTVPLTVTGFTFLSVLTQTSLLIRDSWSSVPGPEQSS